MGGQEHDTSTPSETNAKSSRAPAAKLEQVSAVDSYIESEKAITSDEENALAQPAESEESADAQTEPPVDISESAAVEAADDADHNSPLSSVDLESAIVDVECIDMDDFSVPVVKSVAPVHDSCQQQIEAVDSSEDEPDVEAKLAADSCQDLEPVNSSEDEVAMEVEQAVDSCQQLEPVDSSEEEIDQEEEEELVNNFPIDLQDMVGSKT